MFLSWKSIQVYHREEDASVDKEWKQIELDLEYAKFA